MIWSRYFVVGGNGIVGAAGSILVGTPPEPPPRSPQGGAPNAIKPPPPSTTSRMAMEGAVPIGWGQAVVGRRRRAGLSIGSGGKGGGGFDVMCWSPGACGRSGSLSGGGGDGGLGVMRGPRNRVWADYRPRQDEEPAITPRGSFPGRR